MNGLKRGMRGRGWGTALRLATLVLALSVGGGAMAASTPSTDESRSAAVEDTRRDAPARAVAYQNESRTVAGSAESGLVVAIAFGLVGLLLVTRRRLVGHP